MRRACLYIVLLFLFVQEGFSQSCGHCTTCDVTLSGSTNYMSTKVNEQICILPNKTFTGDITLLHAGCTVSVCGTWSLSMAWSPWNAYTLDIRDTVILSGDHAPSQAGVVDNYGVFTINGSQSLAPSNTFTLTNRAGATISCKGINFTNTNRLLDNYGTIDVNGTVQLATASASISNHSGGVMTASGDVQINTGSTLTNAGEITLDGTGNKFDLNGTSSSFTNSQGAILTINDGNYETDASSLTTNDGDLIVLGANRTIDLNGGATITNKGKIETYNWVTDGVSSILNNYCWIDVQNDFTFTNGTVNGPSTAGEVGAIDVAGVSTWTSGAFASAGQTVDFCDIGTPVDGWDSKNSNVEGGTVSYCVTDAGGNLESNCAAAFLPIELLYFTASCRGDKNEGSHFEWATASEINNDYFTLEGSIDGQTYFSITNIEGAGNSSRMLTYAVDVSDDERASLYFRLKQTDYDGHFTYSDLLALAKCENETPFNIVNNGSANGDITLSLYVEEDVSVKLLLYNISGLLIDEYSQSEIGVGENVITFSSLQRGAYYLKAVLSEKVFSEKLLVW